MDKYECDICRRKFGSETALKQHVNSKHREKLENKETHKTKLKLPKKSSTYLILFFIVLVIGFIVYRGVNTTLGPQIGQLGSTHIHADIGIYLDGKEITPIPPQYYVKGPYMHFEGGPGAGTVIHMHAVNVPLVLLLKSMGMNLDPNCFYLDNGQKYCTSADKTLKMFVKHENENWTQNYDYGNYVFDDLDKILISYGNENQESLEEQMNSVTDYSRDNS